MTEDDAFCDFLFINKNALLLRLHMSLLWV